MFGPVHSTHIDTCICNIPMYSLLFTHIHLIIFPMRLTGCLVETLYIMSMIVCIIIYARSSKKFTPSYFTAHSQDFFLVRPQKINLQFTVERSQLPWLKLYRHYHYMSWNNSSRVWQTFIMSHLMALEINWQDT